MPQALRRKRRGGLTVGRPPAQPDVFDPVAGLGVPALRAALAVLGAWWALRRATLDLDHRSGPKLGDVDEFMSIGDFSGLSGLSPKRLRSYAASGLLPPAAVDPWTAYRYYAPGQLTDARLIDALRRAGLPLAEIRSVLADRRPSRLDEWTGHVRADAVRKQEALAQARELLTDREGTGMTPSTHLHCAGRTEVGHVRENNEDAVVTGERLVAVADGLGGHAGGELASALTTGMLAAGFTGGSLDELAAVTRAADWAVWERASTTPGLEKMGTTVCAAGLLDDGDLAVVHVGDSRAYLVGERSLIRLTEDHTVTAELVRDGALAESDVAGHPHRHVLTRALGVGPGVPVDAVRRPVGPGDVLVLCTDGLTNHVTDDEIATLTRSRGGPQAAVDALVDLALARGGEDNVSVVVAIVRG